MRPQDANARPRRRNTSRRKSPNQTHPERTRPAVRGHSDKDRPATFPQTQLTCPPVPRWHGGLPYRTMFRDTVCRAICVTANRPTRGVVSVYEPLRGLCKPMERKISEIISLDSTTPRSSLKLLIYRQLPKTQLRESRQIRHLPEMTVSSNRRTSRRRKWPAFITPAKAVIVRSSPP